MPEAPSGNRQWRTIRLLRAGSTNRLMLAWLFLTTVLHTAIHSLAGPEPQVANAKSRFAEAKMYLNESQFDSAIAAFDQACEMYLQLDSPYQRIECLYWSARALDAGKHFELAKERYNRAAMQAESKLKQPDPLTAQLFNRMGNFYVRQFEVNKGLEYLLKSRSIRIQLYGNSHPDVAGSNINIAIAFNTNKEYRKAIAHYEEALSILRAQNDPDRRRIAIVHNNLGNTYALLSEYEHAVEHGRKALELFRRNYGQNHYYVFVAQKTVADHYLEWGLTDRALSQYKKALPTGLRTVGMHHREMASLYTGIGDLFSIKTGFDSAVHYYNKALECFFPEFDPKIRPRPLAGSFYADPWIIVTLRKKAASLYTKAKRTNMQRDWELALEEYAFTDSCIDLLRQNVHTEHAKLLLAPIFHESNIYENAITCAWELFQSTSDVSFRRAAFRFSEKSKAIVLLESIEASDALSNAGVPDSMVLRDKMFRSSIEKAKRQLINSGSDETRRQHRDSLIACRIQYDAFLFDLRKAYPAYYNIRFNTDVADQEAIRAFLPRENSALISYFMGNQFLYTFLVTSAESFWFRDTISNELEQRILAYYEALRLPALTSEALRNQHSSFVENGNWLFDHLLSPYAQQIGWGEKAGQHLIIVPHGLLSYVPFEALVSEDSVNEKNGLWDLDYAIRHVDVHYAYSATLLLQSRNGSRVTKGKTLAIGLTFEDDSSGFAPLPHAKVEATAIASLMRGKAYLNEEATKQVMLTAGPSAEVLHLATHAIIDEENPQFSCLVLAGTGSANHPYDRLSLYEIYGMELNTKLAVLSACNTGDGALVEGEGIISLARAFLYAGCESIVMSLWPANDASTSELMRSFYRELRHNKPASQALRAAKLDLIRSKQPPQPYYWAPFVLIGSDVTLDDRVPSSLRFLLIPGLLVAFFCLWLLHRPEIN